LPPLSLWPGHSPAQDARCAALGNLPMSRPTSLRTISARRVPHTRDSVQTFHRFARRAGRTIASGLAAERLGVGVGCQPPCNFVVDLSNQPVEVIDGSQ
jgi:hypothetical protein